MKNAINWFEIPVLDFERSIKFYAAVLGCEMNKISMGGCDLGLFPCDIPGVGGAVVFGNGYKPSAEGTVVYLNAGEDLNIILNRVAPAGGKVITPKTLITEEIGYSAFFIDTEGNRVGLHSIK